MVSKVAVIALVAIVACPILLGYAMNLQETTIIEYKSSNDSVNVTPLLQTGTDYSYASSDTYVLNAGNFTMGGVPIIPIYNTISSVKSAYPIKIDKYTNQSWSNAPQSVADNYFYEEFNYDPASNSHSITVQAMVGGTLTNIQTINNIHSFYYDSATQVYKFSTYTGYNTFSAGAGSGDVRSIILNTNYGKTDVVVAAYNATRFADISSGWYFAGHPINFNVVMPSQTRSVLFSMNLNSITDPNYSVVIYMAPNYYLFEKTTTLGVAAYTLKSLDLNGNPTGVVDFDLYYDPARSDNTYQIYYDIEKVREDSTNIYYNQHIECRYIGGWSKIIGEANAYLTYSADNPYTASSPVTSYVLGFYASNAAGDIYATRTPTLRIDNALFRAFEIPVIKDSTYDPSVYRSNPATTIGGDYLKGYSFTFGGNTYVLDSSNNITMGTHKVPVKGMVLDSIPAEGGGYDNRINGTIISHTASPSTIVFNGEWNASISTTSMEQSSYTKTEWTPGQFGWNGIDQNFLMVGLLTSIGVFIALGLYIRRSRSSLWPLLVVCGGAVVLFFIML